MHFTQRAEKLVSQRPQSHNLGEPLCPRASIFRIEDSTLAVDDNLKLVTLRSKKAVLFAAFRNFHFAAFA